MNKVKLKSATEIQKMKNIRRCSCILYRKHTIAQRRNVQTYLPPSYPHSALSNMIPMLLL